MLFALPCWPPAGAWLPCLGDDGGGGGGVGCRVADEEGMLYFRTRYSSLQLTVPCGQVTYRPQVTSAVAVAPLGSSAVRGWRNKGTRKSGPRWGGRTLLFLLAGGRCARGLPGQACWGAGLAQISRMPTLKTVIKPHSRRSGPSLGISRWSWGGIRPWGLSRLQLLWLSLPWT